MLETDDMVKRAVVSALASATYIADESGNMLELLMPGTDESEQIERFGRAAGFMKLAGSGSGEVMFRWMSAAGSHPMPASAWGVSPRITLFFDVMATVLAALRPLLDPPAAEHETIVAPKAQHHDNVMTERVGSRMERTYGFSTADVHVYVPTGMQQQTVGDMFRSEGQEVPQEPARELPLDRMPTAEEMAAMSPEERRAYIHMDPRFAEAPIATQAPPIDGFERRSHATPYGTATVSVPRGNRPDAPQTVERREAGGDTASPVSPLLVPDPPNVAAADANELPGDDAGQEGGAAPLHPATRRKGRTP